MIKGYDNVIKGKKIQNLNMGIGKLGDPSTIFVRKFRWTLTAPGLSEWSLNKVDFDFVNKTIKLECYEIVLAGQQCIESQEWLLGPLGPMTFTTYDGCGNEIYEIQFKDIVKTKEATSFDYASSEVSVIQLEFTFKSYERRFKIKSPEVESKPPIKHYTFWKIKVNDYTKEFDVRIKNRPIIEFEETEINYLSAKSWIPGKSTLQRITLVFNDKSPPDALLLLLEEEKSIIDLMLYASKNIFSPLEKWTLRGSTVVRAYQEKDQYFVDIEYETVKYDSCQEETKKRS